LTVNFTLDVPAGSYRIEFFKNPSGADPSGNGEGESFVSSINVTHPGGGPVSFDHGFLGAIGDVITSTTTTCTDGATCAAFGNTSEFSNAVTAVGAVTISSAVNQSFTVGGSPTLMAMIDILDAGGTITAVNDIRIRIPLGFPMRWDSATTIPTLGGPAATKVATQVKGFEDAGHTLVLNVTSDFAPSDQLTVSGLKFFSFTAPAAATNVELETENDGLATAFDDKTIEIFPASSPTLSSDDDQAFVTGEPPVPMVPLTVSEGTTASITAANDIRVRIPSSFNMTWDPSVTSAWILGPASSKVSATVAYEDSDRTLVIDVLTPFVTSDFITVSGLYFQSFTAASPSSSLELEVDNAGGVIDLDDKTIRIDLATDVSVFTATATDMQVKLGWVYPAGACNFVRIVRDTAGFPGALDPTLIADVPCGIAGTKDSIADSPLFNGTTYFYSAYVDHGSGYTTGKFVKARPFDTPVTIHWAYSTGATSMASPGLRFQLPDSFVYVVSNDSILHSMRGGASGGDWPAAWKPYKLGGPAQARPPVVSFSVGGGNGAAFLGSQDGRVYAVDSVNGALKWDEPIASMVQAAPAGHFQAYNAAAFDLILVGTRNGSGANSFRALDVHTGNPVWSFVNSVGEGGDGAAIGIISGGAAVDYPNNRAYFASRTHPTGSADTLWCVAFNGGSVTRLWSKSLGNIDGSPILMNGRVYVGTNGGIIHAVNAVSGAVEWSLPLGNGPIKGFPFPRGTNQLFVSTNTKVWSILDNVTFGSVSPGWPVTTIPSPSIPLYVPGTTQVLVGSGDGKLYQMNVVTPLPAKSVTLGDGSAAVGAPTLDLLKMLIYVGTDAGVVYGVTFPLP
jgi:outer membrane protein assembly factor BamB